jgi:hypothetical protein
MRTALALLALELAAVLLWERRAEREIVERLREVGL